MKLTLNQNQTRILVIGQDVRENNKLKVFPGLLRDGLSFFIPTDTRVAYNLVSRICSKFKNVEIDSYVHNIINTKFKLKEIPAEFIFYTEPKPFQRIALRYMYSVRRGGLLLEPGMGKTKIVLDYIALRGFKRSLIVCPKPLLFVWEDERQVHRPDKDMYIIQTTEWNREKKNAATADITVVNYNKAVTLAPELAELEYDFIGLDEALIKSHNSGRTKAMTWLAGHIPYRMLMSGTLVNNSPLDVFAPVRFLEPSLVGTSYFNFEEEYTVKAGKKDENGKYVGPTFTVGYKKVPEVKSILESVSIVMTKAEWLQLPPKRFHDIYIQPSEEQRRAHIELQSNYIVDVKGRTIEVENPLTVLCKLIQISNGFIYTTKDEDLSELEANEKKSKKRETIYFDEQPKLDKLIELLQGDLKDRRVMIWYNMTAEYELIKERLEHEKITYVSIKGGERNVGDKVRGYNREASQRVLLCQAKSVNYGITVLGQDDEEVSFQSIFRVTSRVFTQIFYSRNFSLEVYLQQQDRIHRLGQEQACDYYHLICNLPSDVVIADRIAEKLSIRGQILQDVLHSLGISNL